ncbi:MAG: CIA30 family protein, partial [Candidatus Goldiibacteriota bacterium]
MRQSKLIVFISAVFILAFGSAAVAAPMHVTYSHGIQVTDGESYTSNLNTIWGSYKNKFVTSDGADGDLRVKRPESGGATGGFGDTVSEGMGYGMLLAIYFDDKTTFDGLFEYVLDHLNSRQLMAWRVDENGNIVDAGAATDADTDIAFALIQASKRWGGAPEGRSITYAQYATNHLSKIKQYCIADDNSLKPGDVWDDHEFPSYYSEAFYREYNVHEGNTSWDSLISMCNQHILANQNSSNGLTSETANQDGTRKDDNYGYNACRTPMRYAIDYIWNGDSTAGTVIDREASFFENTAATDIGDGYSVSTGSKTSNNNNATFIGPIGCAFMRGSAYQAKLDEYFSRTAQQVNNHISSDEYYNSSVGLLSLLIMSGHFPKDFGSVDTPTNTNTPDPSLPTNTPTEVPEGDCVLDDGEDGDNENYFGGFWYTYADGRDLTTVSPDPLTTFAMTEGGYDGSLYAANITGEVEPVDAPSYPSAGMGTQLNPDAGAPPDGTSEVTDISSCSGIRFYAKGDGKSYVIKLPYTDDAGDSLTEYDDYLYSFTAEDTWTEVDVPFAFMAQGGWGTEVDIAIVLENAKEFQWQTDFNPDTGTETYDLWIDDIVVYGCDACPEPPVEPTDTETSTPTETDTIAADATETHTFTNTDTFTVTDTPTETHTIPADATATFTPTDLPS